MSENFGPMESNNKEGMSETLVLWKAITNKGMSEKYGPMESNNIEGISENGSYAN